MKEKIDISQLNKLPKCVENEKDIMFPKDFKIKVLGCFTKK